MAIIIFIFQLILGLYPTWVIQIGNNGFIIELIVSIAVLLLLFFAPTIADIIISILYIVAIVQVFLGKITGIWAIILFILFIAFVALKIVNYKKATKNTKDEY